MEAILLVLAMITLPIWAIVAIKKAEKIGGEILVMLSRVFYGMGR